VEFESACLLPPHPIHQSSKSAFAAAPLRPAAAEDPAPQRRGEVPRVFPPPGQADSSSRVGSPAVTEGSDLWSLQRLVAAR
jgi:hypothetical protein